MMDTPNFYISKLKVHNFKNFLDIDVDLERFNVIIGQNASGKSNFKNIFSFLADIIQHGLPYALLIQGGSDQVLNFYSKDRLLSFEVHFSSDFPENIQKLEEHTKMKTTKIVYKFCIKFTQDANEYVTLDDSLIIYLDPLKEPHNISKLTISKNVGKISFNKVTDKIETMTEKRPAIIEYFRTSEEQLLIQEGLFYQILPNWHHFIHSIATYDLNPNTLKLPTTITNFSGLSANGSNLAYILAHIKNNKEDREELLNYIQSLLPFLKAFSIKHHNGKAELSLQEIGSDKNIPAQFVSDGTVNIIALLICMFFEDTSVSVIDEPEHSIYPSLLSQIIELMDVATELKQIIITTHNPDIVEYIPIKNVLLLNRDKQGISTLIKLKDHEMVKRFNDVAPIHTLLRQGLLL